MQNYHRRSIRLPRADYGATGAYFITLCTHEKLCVFGEIIAGVMTLSVWGKVVEEEWQQTAVLRPNVQLDTFVVMPNHFHAILIIKESAYKATAQVAKDTAHDVTRSFGPQLPQSLAAIISTFKAAVTRQIRRLDEHADFKWQRNYYEHIIRDEDDENRIRGYILSNPERWQQDSLFIS